MGLESVLAAMKGEAPPLGGATEARNQLGTWSRTGSQKESRNETEAARSLGNSAVHFAVSSVWRGEHSSARDQFEHYSSQFLAAVPLFVGGKRGYFASAVIFGLNEAKVGDTTTHQLADGALGCAKGALTKYTFNKLGAKKDWNVALKGMSMGASSRSLDVGLRRETWFDSNGDLHPLTGAGTTLFSAAHPVSLATDVLTFGIAYGGIKAGDRLTNGAISASPRLQNMFSGSAFGFTSGTLTEVQRQMSDPIEHFDPLKILARGGASAFTMTLAAGAGYQLTDAAGLQPVVRPQTEPTRLPRFLEQVPARFKTMGSILMESDVGQELAGEDATGPNQPRGSELLTAPPEKAPPQRQSFLQRLEARATSQSSSSDASPREATNRATAQPVSNPARPLALIPEMPAKPTVPAQRTGVVQIESAVQVGSAPWDRPAVLIERVMGKSLEYKGRAFNADAQVLPALGRSNQGGMGNCKMVASLNSLTTDVNKARFLADAIEQRGPKDYRVRVYSNWCVDDQGNKEKLYFDINPDTAQQGWNQLRTTGKFRPTDTPIRGPWYAQLFEYALMQHLTQKVPAQHCWLRRNTWLRDPQFLNAPRDALCSGVNVSKFLGGETYIDEACPKLGPQGLDSLAPEMNKLSVVCGTAGNGKATVKDVDGNSVFLAAPHAFSVLTINPDVRTVTILNPWEGRPPATLKYETFLQSMTRLHAHSFPKR